MQLSLVSKLPRASIPDVFAQVNVVPVTTNGKVRLLAWFVDRWTRFL
jgi:hypothetical protein